MHFFFLPFLQYYVQFYYCFIAVSETHFLTLYECEKFLLFYFCAFYFIQQV